MKKKLLCFFLIAAMLVPALTVPADENCQHEWSEWYVAQKPTIRKTGLKKRECFICDETQSKKVSKLKPYVKFTKKTVKLKVSKTYKLKIKYAKGDSVKKWKSSNKRIATVSKKGKVKAIRKGTAKITVVMKSGKKATCKIKVSRKKKAKKTVETVYWTPGGAVYHRTINCPTLSRSRTIYSGSVSSCPKSRPCKVCY